MVIGLGLLLKQLPIPFTTTNNSNSSGSHNNTTEHTLAVHTVTHKEHIPWNTSHCEAGSAWNDLPSGLKLFVGRDRNNTFIMKSLQTEEAIKILNINGAPGFGKSALAIHVGHQLVAMCIQVRYIDTTEHYWFRGRGSHSDTAKDSNDVRQANLQPWKQSDIRLHTNSEGLPQSKQAIELFSLVDWARSVEDPTVLILDNCDEVLHSPLRDDFLETIKVISRIPHGNMKIIATSQEKLLLQNNFISLEVRELDQTASVELLSQLAIGISTHDAMKLADAVGGSPLALRIVGQMINNSGLEFVPTILDKLKTNPLQSLDKVSDRKSKFRVLMDTACSYLDNATQECAQCLSYFPGSFDNEVKQSVLSNFKKPQDDVETLVTHSLLEEYFLYNDHRFKMHRLIREYFREKDEKKHRSEFESGFCGHFAPDVLNYTVLYVSQDINVEDERKLLTESHNIEHMYEILQDTQYLSNFDDNTVKFMNALSEIAMLFSKPLVLYSKHITRQIFLWLVSENTIDIVCRNANDTCASYYSVILEKSHETLCEHEHDVEGSFDESCELLQCNVTNMTASVCQRFNSTVCVQVMSVNKMCTSVSYTTILSYAHTNLDYVPAVIIISTLVIFWYRNDLPHSIKLTVLITYTMYFVMLNVSHFVLGNDVGVIMFSSGPFILVFTELYILDYSPPHTSKTTLIVGLISVSLGVMYYYGYRNILTVIVSTCILCVLLTLTIII